MLKIEIRSFWSSIFLILCLVLSGCMRTGPYTLPRDQFDYAKAIGDAKKEQILLNIVKLRYAEFPVFLEVNQVVAGYNWEQTGTAALTLKRMFDSGESDTAQLGYTGRFIERPTITFTPLGGDRFMRSILTPAHPEALLTLIEAGWPADRIFMSVVESVNGKTNRRSLYGTDYPADPVFIQFVRLIKKIQIANGSTIKKTEKENQPIVHEIYFRPQLLDAETLQELNEMKNRLGLNPESDHYRIVWGAISEDPNTIAIKTRSVIQVMIAMAAFVEIPTEEIAEGEVVDFGTTSEEDDITLPRLIDIHSGPMAPADAFVTINYQNHSFWIDADDSNSKLRNQDICK